MSTDRGYNAPVDLNYDVVKDQIYISGFNILTDPTTWKKTGTLTSVPDLSGAQMIVWFFGFMLSGDPQVHEIRRTVEIEEMTLKVSGGRDFRFQRPRMKRYTNMYGFPFFVCEFPRRK